MTSENGAPSGIKESAVVNDNRKNTNWVNVLFYIYLHLTAFYGIILIFKEANVATTLLALFISAIAPIGMTMGAHRLWAHRSYQASLPLRIILCLLHTLNSQGSVYDWVLEHRLHHKLRGTPQDPFNHSRGFLFAHINNRFKQREPEMEQLQSEIDMSDLESDAVVMFQKRFYWIIMPILSFLLPINAPVEYWGENFLTSFCLVGILRHVFLLNMTSLIHSGPLIWGLKNGENEADSNMVFIVRKSRWHDYHYMLPWDYRTSEYGSYDNDYVTRLIKFSERQGWASNLRTCTNKNITDALEIAMDLKISVADSVERVLNDKSK